MENTRKCIWFSSRLYRAARSQTIISGIVCHIEKQQTDRKTDNKSTERIKKHKNIKAQLYTILVGGLA